MGGSKSKMMVGLVKGKRSGRRFFRVRHYNPSVGYRKYAFCQNYRLA